jgi:hypothetical protein
MHFGGSDMLSISTTKIDQREKDLASTHIGQLMQWFKDRECIIAPYNFE